MISQLLVRHGILTLSAEQLAQYVDDFAAGTVLAVNWHLRTLNHLGDGIWELKTPDLRVFGWFHVRDCFIAVSGQLTQTIKEHNLYRGLANEAVHLRDRLDLDNPKFVAGTDPNDVVSNYTFPP